MPLAKTPLNRLRWMSHAIIDIINDYVIYIFSLVV